MQERMFNDSESLVSAKDETSLTTAIKENNMLKELAIAEIETQIQELAAKKQQLIAAKRSETIAQVMKLLSDNGLSVADLQKMKQEGRSRRSISKKARIEPGNYKNPSSGEEYAYKRGRAPTWLGSMSTEDQLKAKVG
jgi:hypothetical protein